MRRIRPRRRLRRGPADIPLSEWRNAAYRRFLVAAGRCVACVAFFYRTVGAIWPEEGGCDPAHGPVNGLSSKGPDSGCVPLCPMHHAEMHRTPGGWPAFERLYGFSRVEQARIWWAAFLEFSGQVGEVA